MEDLCCCFEGYDDEPPEFFKQKIVKARKQHFCYECGRDIEPGERYEYIFGKWDGDTSEFKTCLGCMRLRDSMDCGDGYNFGILADHVLNCLDTEIRVDPPMAFSRTLVDRTGVSIRMNETEIHIEKLKEENNDIRKRLVWQCHKCGWDDFWRTQDLSDRFEGDPLVPTDDIVEKLIRQTKENTRLKKCIPFVCAACRDRKRDKR